MGEGIEPSNVHTLHPPPSLPSGVGRLPLFCSVFLKVCSNLAPAPSPLTLHSGVGRLPLLGLLLRELRRPGQLEDDRQTAHRQRGRNQGANAHQEHQRTIVVHL